MVQWFRLGIFTAGDWGSTPGQGTETPQVARHRQKKEKELMLVIENSENPKVYKLNTTEISTSNILSFF